MRYLPQYIYMTLLLLLLQVGLLANLSLGIYLAPIPYVALIILLPLDMSRLGQLLVALALGVAMDFLVGYSSINTIATLGVGFARPYLLGSMTIKDGLEGGGVPSSVRIGESNFRALVIWMVLLHNIIYFSFESLSALNLEITLLRFGCSALFSLVTVGFIARLFHYFIRKA